MKPAPTTNHGPSSSTSSAGSAGSLPGSFPAAPSTPTPTTNTGGLPLGPSPTHSLLLSSLETSRNPFFHRACAYSAERDEVLTTSDLLTPTSQSQLPIILISRVSLRRAHGSSTKGAAGGGSGSKAAAGTSLSADESPPVTTVEWMKLRPPREMPMPADAVPYRRGILYCAQGAAVDPGQPFGVLQSTLAPLISAAAPSATPTSRAAVDASAAPASTSPSTGPSGGLFYMPHGQPPRPLVTSFYGRSFNSPRSAAVAPPGPLEGPAGAIYFTDPAWAYEHEFRPAPILPQHVYRLDPATGAVRVVADGFERPDGIAVAAAADGQGEQVVYVGDGGAGRPGDLGGPSKPATIYAFDVINRGGGPFLANKRVFAYVLAGVPQCIRCDAHGNVWAACGDGIEVWNPGGDLIGLIAVPGKFYP